MSRIVPHLSLVTPLFIGACLSAALLVSPATAENQRAHTSPPATAPAPAAPVDACQLIELTTEALRAGCCTIPPAPAASATTGKTAPPATAATLTLTEEAQAAVHQVCAVVGVMLDGLRLQQPELCESPPPEATASGSTAPTTTAAAAPADECPLLSALPPARPSSPADRQ